MSQACRPHAEGISSLAVEQRGGRLVLTGGEDGALSLLELRRLAKPPRFAVKSKEHGGTGHGDSVATLAWLPDDNRLFVSGAETCIKVWDATAAQDAVISMPLFADVRAVALTNGTSPSAAAALGDNTLRIVDLRIGRAIGTMQGHTRPPMAVAWGDPGAHHLYSGGMDGTIRAWDARMGARSLFTFDPYAHDADAPPLKKMERCEEEDLVNKGLKHVVSLRSRAKHLTEQRAKKARLEPYRFSTPVFENRTGNQARAPGTGSGGLWGEPGSRDLVPLAHLGKAQKAERERFSDEAAISTRHFVEPPRREYEHEPCAAHRGAVISLVAPGEQAPSQSFSGTLLSCGVDGHVRSWDARTGTLTGKTQAFNVGSWTQEQALRIGALGGPEDVCFIPEKEHVVVYCTQSGTQVCKLSAHTSPVVAAEAVVGTGRLLTGGGDGRVLLWEASDEPPEAPAPQRPVIDLD